MKINNLNIEKSELALLEQLNLDLGIDLSYQYNRKLIYYPEEQNCVSAGLDCLNRETMLHPRAFESWQEMKQAAQNDNISILIYSAFRTYARQAELIRHKLAKGLDIETIISVVSPPGFSEHHTGRAIDIVSEELKDLEEDFEQTKAFAWLCKHAHKYNFIMSYPRNNPDGVIYEPWHWCYQLS